VRDEDELLTALPSAADKALPKEVVFDFRIAATGVVCCWSDDALAVLLAAWAVEEGELVLG
jgi:hypothetical protein